MHFLAMLMHYVENYWSEFHQTFCIDAFWNRDERFNVWGQKVEGQGQSMTRSLASGGIRRELDAVF